MKNAGNLRAVARYLPFTALLLLGISVHESSNAAVVQFTQTGKQFSNEKIYESRHFRATVGLVGDLIELKDGEYTFFISAPRSYEVRIDVTVSNINVQVTEAEIFLSLSDGCAEVWETSWETPKPTISRPQMITDIHLPDVRFIRSSGDGVCEHPLLMGCDRRSFMISVESDPDNAEIWIDGRDTGLRTPASGLAGSFCERNAEVDLVLRKSGWINCLRTLNVEADGVFNLHCELRRP